MRFGVEDKGRLDLEAGEQSRVAGNPAPFTKRGTQPLNRLINRLAAQPAAGPESHAIAAEVLRQRDTIAEFIEPHLPPILVGIERATGAQLNRKNTQLVGIVKPAQRSDTVG